MGKEAERVIKLLRSQEQSQSYDELQSNSYTDSNISPLFYTRMSDPPDRLWVLPIPAMGQDHTLAFHVLFLERLLLLCIRVQANVAGCTGLVGGTL